MPKLTAIILARNEEKNIGECIDSVKFADEILVIDDNSEDRTAEIARGRGARVVRHALDGNWGAQQTFAIGEAKGDWIYFIDADERMTPALADEVKKAVSRGEKIAYRNARLNFFCGQAIRHGGWFPDYGLHLLPRDGTYVTGRVHPEIRHQYPEKKFPTDAHLVHRPYRDWDHYLSKMNFYSTLAAEKMRDEGREPSFSNIILHPIAAFCKMFLFKSGWLDGKIGFILAMFHFYYTMAKYVKLYYLLKNP